MITSFEVGAVFKIIDDASPAIRKLRSQINSLNKAIDLTRKNIGELAKSLGISLDPAVAETRALAAEWTRVSTAAQGARRSMTSAAKVAATPVPRGAIPIPGAGAGGGRRNFLFGRRGGGHGGGGGVHVSSLGAPIPGGLVRFRGGGNVGLIAAGALGYGVYEEARVEDAVAMALYHAGMDPTAKNKKIFRDAIFNTATSTGMPIEQIGKAVQDEIRMFRGTPGGGLDVLPEMLKAASVEARLKGTSVDEAMSSLIGLAHMTRSYSPEAIKKLAPAFAFLSSTNPDSLGSIEKAASYAVPILESSMDVDPVQALLLGTVLRRAGATNTKSGTWLRNMAERAMPGTSLMSRVAFKRHEEALRAFGLVDPKGNPTWFTNGVPDLMKMLQIAHDNQMKIPLSKRDAYQHALFGAQGAGAEALLSDPAVFAQIAQLRKEMPAFIKNYPNFLDMYKNNSPVQQARIAWAELQKTLADLATTTLPALNAMLKDFVAALKAIRPYLPNASGQPTDKPSFVGTVLKRGAEIGVAGGVIGTIVPGAGTIAGAGVGAAVGATEGAGEWLWNKMFGGTAGTAPVVKQFKDVGQSVIYAGTAAGGATSKVNEFRKALESLSAAPLSVPAAPIQGFEKHSMINLNVDGRKLAMITTRHIADRASYPLEGSAYHDGTIHATPFDTAYTG